MGWTDGISATSGSAMLAVAAQSVGFAATCPMSELAGSAIRHRYTLAVLLTLILLSTLDSSTVQTDQYLWENAAIRLVIGALLGFSLQALQSGILVAGRLVEQQLGLSAEYVVGDESTASEIGRLFQITMTVLFLAFDGHHAVLEGLMSGCTLIGSSDEPGPSWTEVAVQLVVHSCWFAMRVALPAILALLTTHLTVGMMARMLPQYAGSNIALPAQVALGLMLLLWTISGAGPLLLNELEVTYGWLTSKR